MTIITTVRNLQKNFYFNNKNESIKSLFLVISAHYLSILPIVTETGLLSALSTTFYLSKQGQLLLVMYSESLARWSNSEGNFFISFTIIDDQFRQGKFCAWNEYNAGQNK